MIKFFLPSIFLLAISCSPKQELNSEPEGFNEEEIQVLSWLIPRNEVYDGGPGKDGIPSIDVPKFVNPSEVYFAEDELVILVKHNKEIRAYPHSILNWHEIVNDKIGDLYFAITYCPLTGTAINWNRNINGTPTQFGVSGLLYNSNLIPYDRNTLSNWSQIRMDCVNGELKGKEINILSAIETTWKTAKEFQNLKVLSSQTGYSRDYRRYPYGDYKTNDDLLIFPVTKTDNRLANKERVLGVIYQGVTKVYTLDNFQNGSIIQDQIGDRDIIIVGNIEKNFMLAYFNDSGQGFEYLADQFPNILEDPKGNIFNIFGEISIGPDKESSLCLSQPVNFIGYWFSWAAFYPELILFE